jgi:hypothetical protein
VDPAQAVTRADEPTDIGDMGQPASKAMARSVRDPAIAGLNQRAGRKCRNGHGQRGGRK